jgi:hypothetical protein
MRLTINAHPPISPSEKTRSSPAPSLESSMSSSKTDSATGEHALPAYWGHCHIFPVPSSQLNGAVGP